MRGEGRLGENVPPTLKPVTASSCAAPKNLGERVWMP